MSNTPTILGFDPSLTSSGYAYHGQNKIITGTFKPKKLRGLERLVHIRETLRMQFEVFPDGRPDYMVYEGYAMGIGTKGGRSFDLGELGGVLKVFAYEMGVKIVLVPPASLKMFTTGKGNAKKPEMAEAVELKWGYSLTQDDEVDAFALLKLGEAYLNRRAARSYDSKRKEALKGCILLS